MLSFQPAAFVGDDLRRHDDDRAVDVRPDAVWARIETRSRSGSTPTMTRWATPETGTLVPACVQHSVLDPKENAELTVLLPMPTARRSRDGSR